MKNIKWFKLPYAEDLEWFESSCTKESPYTKDIFQIPLYTNDFKQFELPYSKDIELLCSSKNYNTYMVWFTIYVKYDLSG